MRLRRLARFDALVVTSLLWFLGKFLRYAFPPLFETLGTEYGVSTAVLGTAFTGFMLVYAAMQFPSGLLADRYGSVAVIAAGGLLAASAALAVAVDAPLVALVGAMLCMGAGTGAHKTVAVRLLSRVYPDRTGRALGAFDTFGTFGGVAAPAAVVLVADMPGVVGAPWRTPFLLGGVAGLVLVAAFALRVPERLPGDAPDGAGRSADDGGVEDGEADDGPADASGQQFRTGDGLRRYVRLFGDWRFATFVVVTVLFSFAYNGTVAFLPLYLSRETGLPDATASLLYSLLFVVSLVQLVTGEASDRVGRAPVLAGTLALASAGLVGVVLAPPGTGPVALGGAVALLGLGAHGFRPVRGAYLMSVVPESVAGGSLGAVRTLLMGAGALAPAVVGTLSEGVGLRPAFALLVASLAGATGLAAALWLVEK